MNEERDRDEPAALLRKPQRTRLGEFERLRGENQLPGSPALGNPPPMPADIPIGIAPPDPMVVVSNFDTRPIGAYDFTNTQQAQMGPGEVIQLQDFTYNVPDGFTAVLRRVRFEWTPAAAMNITSPVVNVMVASLMREGVIIPNNSLRWFGELTTYEWPTHHVYGFWESMGVRLAPTGWAIPFNVADSVIIAVTFMGTLIPTKSRPPAVEIASDPVLIRDYDKFIKQAPHTGAAGQE